MYVLVNQHDTDSKTFSSAFNNHTIQGGSTESGIVQEIDDFVEMIFSNPETVKHHCREIYRFFVRREWTDDIENDIISPLSQHLIDSNYNLMSTVQIFTNSAFFMMGIIVILLMRVLKMIKPICNLSELISSLDIGDLPNPEAESDNPRPTKFLAIMKIFIIFTGNFVICFFPRDRNDYFFS